MALDDFIGRNPALQTTSGLIKKAVEQFISDSVNCQHRRKGTASITLCVFPERINCSFHDNCTFALCPVLKTIANLFGKE